jgi:hypothetical protein
MEPADLAMLIGALVGILAPLGVFVWTMFRVARGVSQINRAVNHQAPGDPTLVQRVIAIEERFAGHDDRAARLGDRVGRLEVLGTTRHDEVIAGLAKLERSMSRLGARTAKVEQSQRAPSARTRGAS